VTRYIVRRLIQAVFVLLGVTLLGFALMRLAPGGPSQFVGGEDNPRISPEYRRQLRESFGLDDPVPLQYAKWLRNVLQLDFGRSYIDSRPVIDKIRERIPASFQLALASFVLGLLGIPLGVLAATRRGAVTDQLVRFFTVVGNSVPHWWLGLMILVLSASTIRIFPLGGQYTIGNDNLLDRLWHLALPATIGAFGGWITYSRYVRAELLDVLGQDYVRTAAAKGLSARAVLFGHALRNALMPLATMFGGSILGLILSGALLFEITFSWPGLGRLFVEAAYQRDYPLLMAELLLSSFLYIMGNLLSDISYAWVDPRVRLR
jgi:peptide/nickel transport system permease protein